MRPMLLPTPTTERRSVGRDVARPQVTRAADDTTTVRFGGHAAVFNTRTLIGRLPWGFYEQVAPGAFRDTIADGGESLGVDQAHLLDHDSFYVVSRAGAGTLRMAEDKTGLVVDSTGDTRVSYVADHVVNLEIGNVRGMSIGFYVDEDEWSTEKVSATGPDGTEVDLEIEVRTILKTSLLEASSVTFPAFPTTDVGLRDVATALAGRGDERAIARYAERAPILGDLVRRAREVAYDRLSPITTEPAVRAGRRLDDRRHAAFAAMHGLG